MHEPGNALFIRIRVLVDGAATDIPRSIGSLLSQMGGIVYSDADSEALSFYALIDASDAPALSSLAELLHALKCVGLEDVTIRELVVELGRAADLPASVADDLHACA